MGFVATTTGKGNGCFRLHRPETGSLSRMADQTVPIDASWTLGTIIRKGIRINVYARDWTNENRIARNIRHNAMNVERDEWDSFVPADGKGE